MKIVIVGLGSIAHKHVDSIRKIDPTARIYALRSESCAPTTFQITNLYTLEEVKDVMPDFIIISNPTSKHKDSIEQFINLNCPLFIEKPVSATLDISETVNRIREKGILTYVACDMRFLDVLRYTKDYLSHTTHRINEINVYCGSYLPEWRPNTDFRKIYSAQKALGGGVHLDLIHELDYLYWIFGTPGKVTKVLRNTSSLNIDAYDYANYILEYNTFSASVVLNYFRRDYKRTFEIVFDNTTWLVDLYRNRITNHEGEIFHSNEGPYDTYFKQMKYFWNLVESHEKDSFNSILEAYNVLKICL